MARASYVWWMDPIHRQEEMAMITVIQFQNTVQNGRTKNQRKWGNVACWKYLFTCPTHKLKPEQFSQYPVPFFNIAHVILDQGCFGPYSWMDNFRTLSWAIFDSTKMALLDPLQGLKLLFFGSGWRAIILALLQSQKMALPSVELDIAE